MKKKIIALLLTCALIASCVVALAACGDDKNANGLVFGKKYIWEESINDEDGDNLIYFVFNDDGTGYYYHKESSETGYYGNTKKYDYRITFKYVYADSDKSAVVCFYDSVINDSLYALTDRKDNYGNPIEDTEEKLDIEVSDWTALVTISKDVLSATVPDENYLGGKRAGFYANEDYAKTLEHFNEDTEKPTDDKENEKTYA